MGRVRQHTQNDALTTDTNENGKRSEKKNGNKNENKK